jgi:hypothetical protein
MERLGGFRQQPDGHREIGERFLVLVLSPQEVAAADIGGAVARVGLDGPGEIRVGLLVAVRLAQGKRPVRVGLRVVRVDLNGLGEVGDRVTVAADPRIGRAPGVVGTRIARVALDHVRQGRDVHLADALGVVLDHGNALGVSPARGFTSGQPEAQGSQDQRGETANR